jgi:hypothetical protein
MSIPVGAVYKNFKSFNKKIFIERNENETSMYVKDCLSLTYVAITIGHSLGGL